MHPEANPAAPPESRLWRPIPVVFVSSGCIMVLELVAGRILAPYIGVSIFSWTSVIGVVLGGISLGNFIGGRLADRRASLRLLGSLLSLGGLSSLVILGVDTLQAFTYIESLTPSNALQNVAKRSAAIVASPILRALQTAEILANGRKIRTDDLYVEAPLPAPLIVPFLRAKPWVWGTLSRLTWSYGYSGGGESHRQADARAVLAAQALAGLAAEEGEIMLCGHGWFNRMIGIALRRGGWHQTHNGGDKYWALRTYEMKG